MKFENAMKADYTALEKNYDINSYISFFQYLSGPLYAEFSEAALVVKARSIDYHYRTEWEYLHGLGHRVSSGSLHFRDNGEVLPCYCIYHARFACVPAPEEPYMYPFARRRLIHSCHKNLSEK